jgi:DNA-3-methyladenine glycosylase II
MEELREDPELAELIDRHGHINLFHSADLYQQLVCMIVEQQVSTASARAVQERLFNSFEVRPEEIVEVDEEDLKQVGLSRQKTGYVKNAAEKFIEDDLNRKKFKEMTDREAIDELTGIKGIGEWTAEMFLMFGLGRKDVFSTGDLVLRNAMEELYGITDREEMRNKAEDWKPYRTIACLYLWKEFE